MKVSEKQLLMLVDIAKDSLRIAGNFGGYHPQIRLQLVNDIINQQSNVVMEVDSTKPDKNVAVPPFEEVSEGYDPSKISRKKKAS